MAATQPTAGTTARTATASTSHAAGPPLPLAEEILAAAQGSRTVLQDVGPRADSLDWELGQRYLRQRSNKAFLADATPVPFVINNYGQLSRNAAEVFFASLQAA